MVKWNKEELNWDIADTVVKRFHLGTEEDKKKGLELRNIARLADGFLDADYFDYNFRVMLEENGGRHLVIEIRSPQKGLEEITRYVQSQVQTGLVFSEGFLTSVGKRSEFKKYSMTLDYVGMEDIGLEYAPGRIVPSLRVLYEIKPPLLKTDKATFVETVLNFAVLPFFAYALDRRNK